jgi:DNA repair protein RecO (recombination protein O)
VRKANAKLAGFLENFNLAEIFVAKNQGMGKITGSLVINNFPEIRKNLEIIRDVFDSIKLLGKMIKDENKDQKIFKLLREYLETINEIAKENSRDKNEIISLGFIFKLFEELGYKIEVGNCALCQGKIREGKNYFDPEQGGIVCERCIASLKTRITANPNAIKILRIFFQNSLKSLTKLKTEKNDLNNLVIIKREFLKWID